MVTVQAKAYTTVGTMRCDPSWVHSTKFVSGRVCILTGHQEGEKLQKDYGYINTRSSEASSAYNDCFQYNVEGDISVVYQDNLDYDMTDAVAPACASEVIFHNRIGGDSWSSETGDVYGIISEDGDVIESRPTQDIWETYWERYSLRIQLQSVYGRWDSTGMPHYAVFRVEYKYSVYDDDKDEWIVRHDTTSTYDVELWGYRSDLFDLAPPGEVHFGYLDVLCSLPDAEKSYEYRQLVSRLDETVSFGDLSSKATKSIRLSDINGIAYVKDFLELGSLAKSLTGFLNSSGVPLSAMPKAASAAYLAAHYGLKLTVRDTEALAQGLDRIDLEHETQSFGAEEAVAVDHPWLPNVTVAARARCSGRLWQWSEEQRFFLDKMKQCERALYEFDLIPSFSNIWDLLPWTFVVDWIVPIGDAASRQEDIGYIHTLPLASPVFYSRHFTWSYNVDELSMTGSNLYRGRLTFKIYHRLCEPEFAIPPLRVESPVKDLPSHWIEASALLIQILP